jgi:lipopolysaccharide export system protein LptA
VKTFGSRDRPHVAVMGRRRAAGGSHVAAAMALALAAIVATRGIAAVELGASGISVPFFNDAGTLTHKLVARRGSVAGAVQRLHDVEIVYFSAGDPGMIVQRLEAAEATWDEKTELLAGRGRILVATEDNRVTGEGFDFALATSLLHLHRNVTMEGRELLLTSDRATVELLVERDGEELKIRDIKRCEAIGNLEIVVQPTATKRYPFEKAYSEIAIYDGAKQTVTLPEPTRYVRNGKPAGGANATTIRLRP